MYVGLYTYIHRCVCVCCPRKTLTRKGLQSMWAWSTLPIGLAEHFKFSSWVWSKRHKERSLVNVSEWTPPFSASSFVERKCLQFFEAFLLEAGASWSPLKWCITELKASETQISPSLSCDTLDTSGSYLSPLFLWKSLYTPPLGAVSRSLPNRWSLRFGSCLGFL